MDRQIWLVILLRALLSSADDVASAGRNPVEQIASILRDAKVNDGVASAPASQDIGRALSQALGGAMRNVERNNGAGNPVDAANLGNLGGLNGLGQMFHALSSATAQAAGGPHTVSGTDSKHSSGGHDNGCRFHCKDRSMVKVQDPAYQLWSNGCGTAGTLIIASHNNILLAICPNSFVVHAICICICFFCRYEHELGVRLCALL